MCPILYNKYWSLLQLVKVRYYNYIIAVYMRPTYIITNVFVA